jgi:predicted RNase H-like HicB family nuclease
MQEKEMKVTIIIEKDEFGYYAYCPELEGCHTQGDSLDEVLKNIKEAVELYLETLDEEEKRILLNKEILTTSLEVQVA